MIDFKRFKEVMIALGLGKKQKIIVAESRKFHDNIDLVEVLNEFDERLDDLEYRLRKLED